MREASYGTECVDDWHELARSRWETGAVNFDTTIPTLANGTDCWAKHSKAEKVRCLTASERTRKSSTKDGRKA